ncbi:MAG TPA: hypothetical protein VM345_14085 [Acidimicrobiales bacterium]|nr:hypothetical protein [Acidimicrobiales bacterium]
MPRRGDVDDADLLEPLAPGSDDPLPFHTRATRSRNERDWAPGAGLPVVRARNPKALRLWLLAGALGVLSLLQFAGAAFVNGVEGDLRDLEETWQGVVAIDDDRRVAERALNEVRAQYGDSPTLAEQRDRLYDAAAARAKRYLDELQELDPSTDGTRRLRDEMVATLDQRRRDYRKESVPVRREGEVEARAADLASMLDRWRVDPKRKEPVRLTAARELLEQLEKMADEPTGLRIGAVASSGLYVIDVDDDEVTSRPLQLSDAATIHPVGDSFVVVDSGTATAYRADSGSLVEKWQTAADRGVSATPGETMWVQVANELRLIDGDLTTRSQATLPDGARVVAAPTADRALVVVPGQGLLITTLTGELEAGSGFRRTRGDGSFGTNGYYAAGLDDRGRVLIARLDRDRSRPAFSVLRTQLPSFVDLAVLP